MATRLKVLNYFLTRLWILALVFFMLARKLCATVFKTKQSSAFKTVLGTQRIFRLRYSQAVPSVQPGPLLTEKIHWALKFKTPPASFLKINIRLSLALKYEALKVGGEEDLQIIE